MSKKRIHELAKEYGLSGKELAAKLRARGFSQVKSHMTALDDSEVLHVQAVLEVDGILPAAPSEDADDESLGGVILRKKKKRHLLADELSPEGEEVLEPRPLAPATPQESAVPATQSASEERAALAAESTELDEPEFEVVSEPAPARPSVAQAEPRVTIGPREPQPVGTEAPVSRRVVIEPEPPITAVPAPAAKQVETPEPADAEAPEATLAVDELEPEASVVDLVEDVDVDLELEVDADVLVDDELAVGGDDKKKPKRQGKVVGFIDLTKIRTTAPRKTESRRLGSGDEDMPDVRPTLRHQDPRRAMLRGDRGTRGSLSAAQLREREAGRYLRRNRGTTTPTGTGPRPTIVPRRGAGALGSPHNGTQVRIESPITVKKLAEALSVKASQLLREAFKQLGFGAVNINSPLDQDTAALLANEFGVGLEIVHEVEAEEALIEALKEKRQAVDEEALAHRSPTVAFLGHVDHGKTTLIDAIRNSAVAAGEDGGITQHIGAYRVTTASGHSLTILDTPGHAAFTRMRARGAAAVDVVVLVVAADAGVQQQTEEALAHARAAKTPVVIALTKVDRPDANPAMVMQQLAGIDLSPEEWGGSTGMIHVSAPTGKGIQELLERVFLESELLELQCHPESPAKGVVLEAEIEQGKGIVAHLLVQDGTLHRGDVILMGEGYGKVRSIHDDRGNLIEEAGPSMPVEVSGLSALPSIGEPFHVVDKLDDAKEVAEERARKNRAASLTEKRKFVGPNVLQKATGPTLETVNIILRADVQGSVEVLRQAILDLAQEEVETRVLQAGVGAVTENDILLASTSNAYVIAFRVAVGGQARQAADREGVQVQSYQVLYDVLDDIRNVMEGRLAPDIQEQITGHAEVRRVFKSSKFGNIAGCMVLDGAIARDNRVRLQRDGSVVHTGAIASLRREKDDAREVREGFECGVLLKNYNDLREGDILEAYKKIEVKRTLGQGTSRS